MGARHAPNPPNAACSADGYLSIHATIKRPP